MFTRRDEQHTVVPAGGSARERGPLLAPTTHPGGPTIVTSRVVLTPIEPQGHRPALVGEADEPEFLFFEDGDDELLCGSCGRLLAQTDLTKVRAVVMICPDCETHNEAVGAPDDGT